MDPCLVPVPVRMSNRDTAHGACGELLIRFVDPLDAISMPISVSPYRICHDIKAEFDCFRKRVKNHALRKTKATFLLRCAKDRFNAASAVPFDLFSLWAYQSLHRDDAPTTGAEVFHELLTWCDAFEGPDAQAHTDRLIEVSDLLGCRYTSLMLALGLYKGYRANSESIHILNCIYSFVILQPNTSSELLCELNFLERAIFTAGTFRAIRASCSGSSSSDMFPSAIEVALAVESCVQQTVGMDMNRVPTPGPLPQPPRRRRIKVSRARRRYQSTPPFPSQPRSSQSMDTATPAGLASLAAFSLAGPAEPTVPTSACTQLGAVSASTQKHNAGASSQQPVPTSSSSHRRPRSLPVQRRRSSSDTSSDEDQDRRAAPKRPASHASSSSSSSSSGDDESSSDGDGPPAPKRQRHAGKQPAYSRRARRETARHPSWHRRRHRRRHHRVPPLPAPSPVPLPTGYTARVPSWHIEPPAVHCSTVASLLMEENRLHEQFLDFVTNFHANASGSGVQLLVRLAERHHALTQRRWWQIEQQRRREYYRVAVADNNSTGLQLDHSLARQGGPAVPMPGPRPPQSPSPAGRGSTHLGQHPETVRHGHYEQNPQREVRYAHEVHHPARNRQQCPAPYQGQHYSQGQHQPFQHYQPYQPQQLHQGQQDHYLHGPNRPAPSYGLHLPFSGSHLGGQPSSSHGRHTGFATGSGEAAAHAPPLLAPQPRPLRVRLDEERLAHADGVPAQASGSMASTGVGVEANEPGEGSQAGPHRDDHRHDHQASDERDHHDGIKDEMDGAWENGHACE